MVMGTFTATDICENVSDPFEFKVLVKLGKEACSQGFWKNHYDQWGPSGYTPDTLFLEAFEITDLSSQEIPSDFNPQLTLGTAINNIGGALAQALLQGTAALLNAAHPAVDFPAGAAQVRMTMQAAFAGDITFSEALAMFNLWNAAERECGCPIS